MTEATGVPIPDSGSAQLASDPMRQTVAASLPHGDDGWSGPPSTQPDTVGEATQRETSPPSPQEIADRVYHLFCQDLRRERERQGRWR